MSSKFLCARASRVTWGPTAKFVEVQNPWLLTSLSSLQRYKPLSSLITDVVCVPKRSHADCDSYLLQSARAYVRTHLTYMLNV